LILQKKGLCIKRDLSAPFDDKIEQHKASAVDQDDMWQISRRRHKSSSQKVLRPRKLEYTIINPLFGYMFRVNGCAESIRFYSSELKIKYEDTGERIYKQDDSEDTLTSLLIQLFPSHTGVLHNLRRIDINFTNKYFIENKAWYDENETDRIANIKMLGSTFASLVKEQYIKENKGLGKSKKKIYNLFEYYVLSPSIIPGLDSKTLKLLTIHAYAVDIFDTPNELEIYLNSILENLEGAKNAIIHLELTKKQKQLFKHLYTDPFKFPYSKINQPVSNSSIPIYDRKMILMKKTKNFQTVLI